MPATTQQRVFDLLRDIQHNTTLEPIKRLFWTELNYDRANEPISTRGWPESATEALDGEPLRLAEHPSQFGRFDIIYCRLRDAKLLITPQRPVINRLLTEFPHALYLFSDANQTRWHFVNVKYDKNVQNRRLFRRITVGPGERLRTAAERIAMLDLASLSPDLFGLSPLVIQQRHDEAFDVEAVTRAFFRTYREIFEATENAMTCIEDRDACRMFTQKLFNRLMFIIFLERKGWLSFDGETGEYLRALWSDYRQRRRPDSNFYRDRLWLLFFFGLNNRDSRDMMTPFKGGFIQDWIGKVPYLNGGLFEQEEDDRNTDITVPDDALERAIDELFYRYNFTVTESTPLDVEVAVDPEMLGKIFEELVTGRHETGSYYTPKPVVSFMGREALKGYLQTACPRESADGIAAFVDDHNPDGIRNPEAVLEALKAVTICDLACGSGAYLLGMMRELFDLRERLFAAHRLDPVSAYQRKLDIIQTNLYGVDIDPFAVNIARLRLWLSLIVDFEGENPPPLPNLDFKIEVGDSILGPDPSGGLTVDMFRQQEIDKYLALKADYMRAHDAQKAAIREQIVTQREQIKAWTPGASEGNGFDWAVEFAEVFARREGQAAGFDIVITNPPYVRQELIKDVKPALRRVYGDLYSGTADLYVYFYLRALQMLRPVGMLAFISSDKFLRAGYAQVLRAFLSTQTTLASLIDFGELPVFGATVEPAILVARKAPPPPDHETHAVVVRDMGEVEYLGETLTRRGWKLHQAGLSGEWMLEHPMVLTLVNKLRAAGKPLGELLSGEMYRGIITGYNDAFVINEDVRQQLVTEDPNSVEVIRRWIRGQDVKRWRVDWHGLYVIAIQNSGDEDTRNVWGDSTTEHEARQKFRKAFPAIHDYLSRYEPALRIRQDQGRFWWELRACRYYAEFQKPKIVYQEISRYYRFAFDVEGYYTSNKCFIIPTMDLYLFGILASSTMEFFARKLTATERGGFTTLQAIYMQQLPIPTPTAAQRAAIESIVRQLLDLKGQGPQVAVLEAELNRLVYQVYGLTAAEIALIEGQG